MALLNLVQDLPKLSDPILGRNTTPEGALGGVQRPSTLGAPPQMPQIPAPAGPSRPFLGSGTPSTPGSATALTGQLSGLQNQLGSSLATLPFSAQTQGPGDITGGLIANINDPFLAAMDLINRGGTGNPRGDLERAINARVAQLSGSSPVSSSGPIPGYGVRDPNIVSNFDISRWTSNHQNGQIPQAQLAPLQTDPGFFMQSNAAAAWDRLNSAYAQQTGRRFSLTGSYRDLATQQRLYAEHQAGTHPAPVATPGASTHGWGLAVDINTGDLTPDALAWLRANAPKYGFTGLSSENWHWEFGQHDAPASTPPATPLRRNRPTPQLHPTPRRRNQSPQQV